MPAVQQLALQLLVPAYISWREGSMGKFCKFDSLQDVEYGALPSQESRKLRRLASTGTWRGTRERAANR